MAAIASRAPVVCSGISLFIDFASLAPETDEFLVSDLHFPLLSVLLPQAIHFIPSQSVYLKHIPCCCKKDLKLIIGNKYNKNKEIK